MFPVLELYDDAIPRPAAMNMALDEVLWRSATRPLLRVYQWDHPALSFGYFGRYKDVAHYEVSHNVVRRCTGGGIVFHGNDLTYALIIPAADRISRKSAVTVYEMVHQAITTALAAKGVAATLVPASSRSQSLARGTDACFANPVAADVMVGQQKIAGAAQRRSRGGLLQQGSIQNVQLPSDFCERFAEALSANVDRCELDHGLLEKALDLSRSKYGTTSWLRRR